MLLSLYFMLPSKSGCLLSEKLGQWGPGLNGWVWSQRGRQRGLALTHYRSCLLPWYPAPPTIAHPKVGLDCLAGYQPNLRAPVGTPRAPYMTWMEPWPALLFLEWTG